jgi:hypothetical protein
VVTVEALLMVQAHRAQGGTDGSSTRVRIAPISRTWAFCQTRFENSGANGAKSRIIAVGRVRTRSPLLWRVAVTSVPYPFRSQMTKVELSIVDAKKGNTTHIDLTPRQQVYRTEDWYT